VLTILDHICSWYLFNMVTVDDKDLGDSVYVPKERYGTSWIWNDEWSSAEEDRRISLWMNEGGTVITTGHDARPTGGVDSDDVANTDLRRARPVGFQQIWIDKGSVGRWQLSIWQVLPPVGYVAVGDVAVGSHEEPDINSVWCVHASQCREVEYTVRWNEAALESDSPCTLCTCDGADGYLRATAAHVQSITGHAIVRPIVDAETTANTVAVRRGKVATNEGAAAGGGGGGVAAPVPAPVAPAVELDGTAP
jgi:hypothetical protein